MITRRKILMALGAGALMPPRACFAQQTGKVWRIGMLETTSMTLNAANLDAFRRGLREFRYVEGQNLVIEYRSTDGRPERFPSLATELVRLKVDLIVTRGTPSALAAKNATGTIPIVMAGIGEPLGTGVVASLARPGGNVTGQSSIVTELQGKRLELLRLLVPSLTRIAGFYNMSNTSVPPQWKEIEAAVRDLGIKAQLLDVRKTEELESAFNDAVKQRAQAILVGLDGFTQANRQLIVELAARHRLPAIYASREFVEAGGLITYGVNYPQMYYRAASFVDKIFKGTKPGDLPVEQPIKFELMVNLKTAKALGLTIPNELLLRADEVIE